MILHCILTVRNILPINFNIYVHVDIFQHSDELLLKYMYKVHYQYHLEKLIQSHLSLYHEYDVLHHCLIPLQVDGQHLAQSEVMQLPGHTEVSHQLLPMMLLQSFRLQLSHKHVHLYRQELQWTTRKVCLTEVLYM